MALEMEVRDNGVSQLRYLEALDAEESSTEQSGWLVTLRKRKQRSTQENPNPNSFS